MAQDCQIRVFLGYASRHGQALIDWALYLPECWAGDAPRRGQKGLLIRRKIKKPEDVTFYLTLAPAATTLAELVRVAGMRWTVESCFETAKGEVGLDQYEVRSWTG
jgi:SRSO17 transposase